MDKGPLVKEAIAAGAELVREFDKFMPVATAFWLKAPDADYRYLYIASERLNGDSPREAYGRMADIVQAMDDPDLDMFQVKMIGADDDRAQAAIEEFRRYPEARAKKYWGRLLGDTFAEELYIYPPLAPVAAA